MLLRIPQKQAPFGWKNEVACTIYALWTNALLFGLLFKPNSFFAVSVLIYSLLDVCVMCCRDTPNPGSHAKVWRRRMTLRSDLEGRLEDSLTGNLWPASAQPRWPLNTERFNKAQTSSGMIFAFMRRHTTVIKKEEEQRFVICSIFFHTAKLQQMKDSRDANVAYIIFSYGIPLNRLVQND